MAWRPSRVKTPVPRQKEYSTEEKKKKQLPFMVRALYPSALYSSDAALAPSEFFLLP